jgi:hypothetical protein
VQASTCREAPCSRQRCGRRSSFSKQQAVCCSRIEDGQALGRYCPCERQDLLRRSEGVKLIKQ